MKTYPAIELLVQGYLTFDWPEEYGEVWQALDDFVAHEPVASLLGHEIDELLALSLSEERLSAYMLGTLGSGYLPASAGFTWEEFLLEVRRRALDLSH